MWIFSFATHSFFLIFGVSRFVGASLCYKDVKVHCSNETSVLDSKLQNSQTDWCTQWCKQEGLVSYSIVNNATGRFKFKLRIPSKCQGIRYKIGLINKSIGYILSKPLTLCLTADCEKTYEKNFEFEVDNIIRTVDKIEIKAYKSIEFMEYFPCLLGTTSITRPQKKSIIYNNAMGSDLIITAEGGCIRFAGVIDLKINNSYCVNKILQHPNMNATFNPTIENGYRCSGHNEKETCYCSKTGEEVKCRFTNISAGNYCASVHMHNKQCPNVIQKNFTFEPLNTDSTVHVSMTTKASVIVVTGTIILLLFLTGITILYKRNVVKPKVYTSLPLIDLKPPSKIEEVPTVFLAYPRDCPLFMDTMAEFRKILSEYSKAEVYDIWDTDIWEQVAEQKESWALKYCYDPKVKVILMATHCSIFIHDSLINGQEIEYIEPDAFDNVFFMVLKSIMAMSATEALYKRVFVVRLDGTDCEENAFKYICPFTVYTIPQQLHTLSLFIKNCDYCEINNSVTVTGLSSSIEKLNQFKTENPDYINNLICTK